MKIGQRVKLNGKRNNRLNGRMATIVKIFTRTDGREMVEVDQIENLEGERRNPGTRYQYFSDQVEE